MNFSNHCCFIKKKTKSEQATSPNEVKLEKATEAEGEATLQPPVVTQAPNYASTRRSRKQNDCCDNCLLCCECSILTCECCKSFISLLTILFNSIDYFGKKNFRSFN